MSRYLTVLAAMAAALTFAACGGAGDAPAPAPAATGEAAPAAERGDAVALERAREHGVLNEAQPPGTEPGDTEAALQQGRHPCKLVSARDARAAFGTAIHKPQEGLQGPTCVYRTRSGDGMVMLSVQALTLEQLGAYRKTLEKTTVAGLTAYCGGTSQSTLYVPLSGGRLMTVAGVPARRPPASKGRCTLMRTFATKALTQLTA